MRPFAAQGSLDGEQVQAWLVGPNGSQLRPLAAPPKPVGASLNLYIDPSDASGNAGPSNAGTSPSAPLDSWDTLCAGFGTYSPRLTQNTTVTFLSGHPNANDIVYWEPRIENGAQVEILGTPTVVQSGTFSALTPRSRTAPQLLNATFGSSTGLQAGLLCVNTTRSSRAWTYTNSSGSSWNLSQPLPTPAFPQNITPNQDNSWANGDSYTLYSLPSVNLRKIVPHVAGFGALGSGTNPLFIKNISVSPGTNSTDAFHVGGNATNLVECQFTGGGLYFDQQFCHADSAAYNCDFGGYMTNIKADLVLNTAIFIIGGQARGTVWTASGIASLQSDLILATSFNIITPGSLTAMGSVYIESGKTLKTTGGGLLESVGNANYGFSVWGPGALDVGGTTRWTYPSGANEAHTVVFLQTGGFTLNGSTSCLLSIPGNSLVASKTLTATNLDSDLGSTLGAYVNPNGASVTNESS